MKRFLQFMCMGIVALLAFASCGDDEKEPQPFHVEKTEYEVPLKGGIAINIVNGSGKIDVKVDNEAIATASYEITDDSRELYNYVLITPKAKGKTLITITDNVQKVSQVVTVKVVDDYVALTMEEGSHAILVPQNGKRYVAYLIDNAKRECLFFENDNGEAGKLVGRGTYQMEWNGANGQNQTSAPIVTLTYYMNDKSELATEGKAYTERFDMKKTLDSAYGGYQIFVILDHSLGLGWNMDNANAAKRNALPTRTSPKYSPRYRMDLIPNGTEEPRVITGFLKLSYDMPIPMGVLE